MIEDIAPSAIAFASTLAATLALCLLLVGRREEESREG